MPTICETEPAMVPYSATRKVQLENITGPVDRTFKVYGLSECRQVTIVVKDAAGNIIWGPKLAPDGTNLGTEYYWTAEIDLMADYASVTVHAYCVNEEDGDHRGGIEVVKGVITINFVDEPGPGLKRLRWIYRINHWKPKWQSAVLVVSGRITGGGTVKYGHIFTENPHRELSFDFGLVKPGLYLAQLTYIDGQTSVTTLFTRKLL